MTKSWLIQHPKRNICSNICLDMKVRRMSLLYFFTHQSSTAWTILYFRGGEKIWVERKSENMIIAFGGVRMKHLNKHKNICTLTPHTAVNVHVLVSSYLASTHSRWRNWLGYEHTHTPPHGFPLLASHHNHVIHLSHTCAPTHSDSSLCGSPTMPGSQCGWNPPFLNTAVIMPNASFCFYFSVYMFCSSFFISPALPLSSLSLNPGLANNKERLWLKLAIHQILFLSFSLCRNERFYSTLVSLHPLVLFFPVYMYCKLPFKSAIIKACLLKAPTDISYLHTWLFPEAAWKVESQHVAAVSDKEGSNGEGLLGE